MCPKSGQFVDFTVLIKIVKTLVCAGVCMVFFNIVYQSYSAWCQSGNNSHEGKASSKEWIMHFPLAIHAYG